MQRRTRRAVAFLSVTCLPNTYCRCRAVIRQMATWCSTEVIPQPKNNVLSLRRKECKYEYVKLHSQGRIMVPPGPEAQATAGPRALVHIGLFAILNLLATVTPWTHSRSLCHRPSVYLSVCRLSVTFVHPTQAIEIFGSVSTPFGTTAIYWHDPASKILRSSQWNPSVGGVKLNTRGVLEYSNFGPIERCISETVQDI